MSEKPVAERLQVKGERRLAVMDAPPGLEGVIGAETRRAGISEAEVVLVFARDRAALDTRLATLPGVLSASAILWVAYPKLTSPLAGDLNRDVIRRAAPDHGLDPVSQIAIDDDWSALRLKRLN